ncbi:phage portal protein [Domibacillus antri]|uniref:Phage portal protein n=1 Tax=Domibacillus antri TaxID=1714264 RepID=A0A1Q8Q3E0_9BACI|nr:HK97 gp10 family phage protein [Domibacillus antri]OLN21873.1 phage portal protein [Domibacillus antri]
MKINGLKKFLKEVEKAADGGFKKDLALWLEGSGMEFLAIIQDEIIRTGTVDTRRLLNSFQRGDSDSAWSLKSGSLTLEVGTNLTYASLANDGHTTVDLSSGKDRRWVPGRWKGDRFEYDPNERESGMLLKVKWVDGSGYWDNAVAIFEKMFDKSLERRLQGWMDSLGGA